MTGSFSAADCSLQKKVFAFILVGEDRQKEIDDESGGDKCSEAVKSKVKWIVMVREVGVLLFNRWS